MDAEDKALYCKKKFGYGKIEWQIKNYFIGTCRKNWIIHSPVFSVSGCNLTKWRLSLKGQYIEGKIFVSTFLERSECNSFPNVVRVNWKLIYTCGSDVYFTSESTYNFQKKSTYGMEISNFEILESKMLSTSCNTFNIHCLMIVYNKDSDVFDRSKDLGLKSLSQDLAVLYRLKQHGDVIVNIDGLSSVAHKAVLFSRNKLLRTEIENGNPQIELPGLDLEETKNVLAYLYTGNLDYVIRRPSFQIRKSIVYLNIEELESYYIYEELELCTQFGVREISFTWMIEDAKSRTEDCITSSVFRENITNMSFQLYLYKKGLNGKSDYMSIFLEIVEATCSDYFCLEFAIMDINGGHHFLRRKRWAFEDGEKQGFDIFVSRDVTKSCEFLWYGMLRIACNIKIPDGSQSLTIVKSKTQSDESDKTENHYELLSKQIAHLFETGKYSDFTIKCGEICFKVHKCILSTRSHKFKEILSQVGTADSTCIFDMEPKILRSVLSYIYSGRLTNYAFEDLFKIYAAAERFSILPLRYACSSVLENHIDMHNIVEILNLSNRSKDFKLKYSSFKFICKNLELFLKDFTKSSASVNEHLIKEFLRFLSEYLNVDRKNATGSALNIEDFSNNNLVQYCSYTEYESSR